MMQFIRKNRWALIAGVAGGIGGFLYWRLIGCASGTCPIKSVWYWSTLWGMAFGYLLGDLVADWVNRKKQKQQINLEKTTGDSGSEKEQLP